MKRGFSAFVVIMLILAVLLLCSVIYILLHCCCEGSDIPTETCCNELNDCERQLWELKNYKIQLTELEKRVQCDNIKDYIESECTTQYLELYPTTINFITYNINNYNISNDTYSLELTWNPVVDCNSYRIHLDYDMDGVYSQGDYYTLIGSTGSSNYTINEKNISFEIPGVSYSKGIFNIIVTPECGSQKPISKTTRCLPIVLVKAKNTTIGNLLFSTSPSTSTHHIGANQGDIGILISDSHINGYSNNNKAGQKMVHWLYALNPSMSGRTGWFDKKDLQVISTSYP